MKTISLNGVFGWEITAQNFKQKIKEDSKEKLRILLNSPGGDPYEAFEMYNIVRSYKGEVEIVIGAMAASAASYFAMSVPLENRKGFKNSSAMIHEAQAGARGKAKDLKVLVSVMEGVNNILAEAYVEGMKGEKNDIVKKMDDTHYMTGWEQLVENNFISDIIDAKDIEIPDEPENESMMVMFLSALEKEPDINNIKAIVDMTSAKVDMSMYNKIAALLPTQTESIPEEIQVEDIKITEEKMELKDYLDANPTAQAEIDELLRQARDEEKAKTTDIQNVISKILEIENIEVSEEAKKTIMGEMTMDAYKDFIILNKAEEKKSKESAFGAGIKTKQTPQDQAPDVVAEVKPEEIRAKVKNVIDSIGGI